jgi:phage shock protein B
MADAFIPIFAIAILFIGLPWLIFHYVTRWKQASSLTIEDENLLDELHEMALKLEERMRTVERLIAADHAEREEQLPLKSTSLPRGSEVSPSAPAITDGTVERLDIRTREQRI